MTGAATLRLANEMMAPDRPFSLRWVWSWRSAAGQIAEFDRLIAVARADTPQDDPVPPASAALARKPCWPRTRLPGLRAGPPATC